MVREAGVVVVDAEADRREHEEGRDNSGVEEAVGGEFAAHFVAPVLTLLDCKCIFGDVR